MSNPLSSHLHFASSSSSSRSPVPPAGSSLLVTDTLAASADFLLVHFLTAQLRRGKHVVFLACGEAEGHWKALVKKLGTTLDSEPNFTFIDGLSRTYAFNSPSTDPPAPLDDVLRPLYDRVLTALKGKSRATGPEEGGEESEVMLILEGVSSLSWSGVDAVEVQRLLRAIQIQAEKLQFSTITHLHTTPSTGSLPTDPLFQLLHDSSDLWIKVAGLSSGRSADVSGELSFLPSTLLQDPSFPATQPGKELQYKLGDNSVEYFSKGTGRGFL